MKTSLDNNINNNESITAGQSVVTTNPVAVTQAPKASYQTM